MITISPWRSAKWPGTSFQPELSITQGPAHVERQRERPERALERAVGERCRHEQPHADGGAHGQAGDRVAQPGVVAAGDHEQHDLRVRTTAYAQANRRPRSPKACGTQSATTSSAAIAAKIAKRTMPSSGSTTLVSHA